MWIRNLQSIFLKIKESVLFRCIWYVILFLVFLWGVLENDETGVTFVYNNF